MDTALPGYQTTERIAKDVRSIDSNYLQFNMNTNRYCAQKVNVFYGFVLPGYSSYVF